MNPASITPLVLAWNESANIGRCLDSLSWAERVVVVDSFSDDGTLEICARFPNVEVVSRAFDTFAHQCNFGLSRIRTEWVLSLDADYVVPSGWCDAVRGLDDPAAGGYSTRFVYRVFGRPLRCAVYPPRTTLYRRAGAAYVNDGHAHHVRAASPVIPLDARLFHDDRKPLARWFAAQARYAREEADKLESTPRSAMGFADRLRCGIVLAPPAMLATCLILRGGILDGWPGWYYALQRTCAELMLSLELLDRKLRRASR